MHVYLFVYVRVSVCMRMRMSVYICEVCVCARARACVYVCCDSTTYTFQWIQLRLTRIVCAEVAFQTKMSYAWGRK